MFWITVAPSRISGMALLINIQLLLNEYISERMNNHWLTTDSPLNFIFLHVLYILGANSCEWLNFLCCLLTVLAHDIQQLYALLGHILISPVHIGSFSEKLSYSWILCYEYMIIWDVSPMWWLFTYLSYPCSIYSTRRVLGIQLISMRSWYKECYKSQQKVRLRRWELYIDFLKG